MSADKTKTITISGRKIQVEITHLDILDLEYYEDNPRVNSILATYQGLVGQEIIEKELWALDSTKDLYQDIKKNRGLIEEIIVKDGKVLEGNSRLCAYRYLFKHVDDDDKPHWQQIRARVLPSDITEEEIFVLLGTFHIRGKAKWRTYEQASYITRMIQEFKRAPEDIAEMIGGKITRADIENMILSYETMKDYEVTDLDKYSYFFEYFKNRKLRNYNEDGTLSVEEFANLVLEDRIPRAEDVRRLPDILEEKNARRKFLEYGESFQDSLQTAHSKHPEKASTFYGRLKKITDSLRKAKIQRIEEEITSDTQKKHIIKRFVREVSKFSKNLDLDQK